MVAYCIEPCGLTCIRQYICSMHYVSVEGLTKSYGINPLFKNISLVAKSVRVGRFLSEFWKAQANQTLVAFSKGQWAIKEIASGADADHRMCFCTSITSVFLRTRVRPKCGVDKPELCY